MVAVLHRDRSQPLIDFRSNSMPPVPPIVREPLLLGQVAIPSRFFLAPLAGYTSLAFRLAVRECGGLGLATTDLVNARSLIEGRRRAFELAETCRQDRPMSIQIFGSVIAEMEQAAQVVVEHGASAVDINMGVRSEKWSRPAGARHSCARRTGPQILSPRW
jgi:tRNA-dihydrouridine synthase B